MTGHFHPAPNPSIAQTQAARPAGRAHVLVIGNEKGGSGKSTTALHIAVALLGEGARVATLDLDARQGTLGRYLENRAAYARRKGVELPMPVHAAVPLSTLADRVAAEADEKARFEAALEQVIGAVDFVIVDTPGSDTYLSRLAHISADTLLTPLNDSFIDLDLLARVDPDTLKILRPSIYAEAVWKQRQLRAVQGGRPVDWVVMRNRLSSLAARNKRDMGTVHRGTGQAHRLSHGRGPERARHLQGAVPERAHLARSQARRRRAVADAEPRRGASGGARPRGGAQSAAARRGRAIGRARDSASHRRPASCRMNSVPNAQA